MCQSPWTTPKYFYPPYLWTTRFFPLYANFAKWPFLFALDFGLNDIKAQNILQIFKDSELFNWLLKIYEWSFYDKDEVVYKKYVINLSNRNSVTKKKNQLIMRYPVYNDDVTIVTFPFVISYAFF